MAKSLIPQLILLLENCLFSVAYIYIYIYIGKSERKSN